MLKTFPDECVDTCVTSPPYFQQRDYSVTGQIGLEKTPEEFIKNLVDVFSEVRRVMKKEATLWVNIGDSYWNKHKHPAIKQKDLVGVPWMLAFALRAEGFYLRQDIIWEKPNVLPESVTDRCTKSHEYIFLLSKSKDYYYDADAIAEPCVWDTGGLTEERIDRAEESHKAMPTKLKNGIRPKKKSPQTFGGKKAREGQAGDGDPRNGGRSDKNSQWGKVWAPEKPTRNKRSVWTVAPRPYTDAHFAVYPEDLIIDCIKAGCPPGGLVLDPFSGSGTTALVAKKNGRDFIGIDLNEEYIELSEKRFLMNFGMFHESIKIN